MSTVGSSALFLSTLDLEVSQLQSIHVESLDLWKQKHSQQQVSQTTKTQTNLSVAFEVLQQTNDSLNRLLGPSALSGVVDLGLRVSPNTASEAAERDGGLVVKDLLQVLLSLAEVHSSQSHDGFASVLEVDAQVRPTGLGRLGGVVDLLGVVPTCHVCVRERERKKRKRGTKSVAKLTLK